MNQEQHETCVRSLITQAANIVYTAGQLANPPTYAELAAQVRALSTTATTPEQTVSISVAEYERQEKLQQASLARIIQLEAAMVAAGLAVPSPDASVVTNLTSG